MSFTYMLKDKRYMILKQNQNFLQQNSVTEIVLRILSFTRKCHSFNEFGKWLLWRAVEG